MSDITRMLNEARAGGPDSLRELYNAVYDELRAIAAKKLSSERPGHTLQATALVHEAYLRLSRTEGQAWENKAHFFSAAAEAMRRILVESVRRKHQLKRGGDPERVDLPESRIVVPVADDRILMVHEALDELAREDSLKAKIVKLRFFVGLSHQEIGEALEMHEKTVRRHWALAKVRLYELMTGKAASPGNESREP